MVQRVEMFISLWAREAATDLLCGRRGETLSGELEDLERFLGTLKTQVDPYNVVPTKIGTLASSTGSYKPIDASRLRFRSPLGDWNVSSFLGPQYYLPYVEPALLAKAHVRPGSWAWPRARPGDGLQELALFSAWDKAGLLQLVSANVPPYLTATAQLFQVRRDETRDRRYEEDA